jgi:hypothetical protein
MNGYGLRFEGNHTNASSFFQLLLASFYHV